MTIASQIDVFAPALLGQTGLQIIPITVGLTAVLILLLVGCMVLYMSLRHARHSREMLHAERLKAIETGMPWQDTDADSSEKKFMHNAFWISFWMVAIGCGSPFNAVSAAMDEAPFESQSVAIAAWLCAVLGSVGSAICATVLMLRSRKQNHHPRAHS